MSFSYSVISVMFTGAALKPFITTLEQTKDWSRLQCEVNGASPKPKVEWKDSSGNKLPAEEPQVTDRGGSYDIILQTTVTKTDYYHCVVTQEEINHQTEAKIHVYIGGLSIVTVVVAVVIAVLCTLLVVGVVLAAKRFITQKHEDSEKRKPLNDSVSQSEQLQPPQTSPVI
ncbi:butyrophilin-like protein 1 [Epinephelus fuscoguttatus]|uniref:butyrophilin-like protein 1 n=1 Tax=Epinephelus fuscoguttatus TaxID=293821 RepID=UPI0020D15015|nr:butyrophilin-like protein 1 [Epinephelus fuscoguttatus]